jgi:hypothetical protein
MCANVQKMGAEIVFHLSIFVPAIFYLGFSFFSLLLAISRPRYGELWMFSAFCGSLFLLLFAQSPYCSNLSGSFPFLAFSHCIVAVSAVGLSLAFFRTPKKLFAVVIAGSAALFFFTSALLSSSERVQSRGVILALLGVQTLIFFGGFRFFLNKIRFFRNAGLDAYLPAMRRRLINAGVLAFVLLLWFWGAIADYGEGGFLGVWQRSLLWFAPTFAMFLQFYWMIMAGQRFREKLSPKLDYIDYLAIEMGGAAAERSYTGVLASFDLKGFKRVTSLKSRGILYRDAVNNLLNGLRDEIEKIVVPNKVVFRFKSNGDEWVWVLYAKDTSVAKETLQEIVKSWQENSYKILNRQKDIFAKTVGDELDLSASMVLDFLDLHVMFCVLSKVTISLGSGDSFPEFYADGFTNLSETFKTSRHNAVAMFREEAEAICSSLSFPSEFERSQSAYCDAGYLKWDVPLEEGG